MGLDSRGGGWLHKALAFNAEEFGLKHIGCWESLEKRIGQTEGGEK